MALAGRERGRVTLMHVAHPLLVEAAAATYGATFVTDDASRELRNAASTALATFRDGPAPEIDIVVCVGDPASEILQCADDRHADSIVMGTQGLSGFKKMFFGSVTEHVLRRSRVPVLAVPAGDSLAGTESVAERIGRVMAPVDFSDRSIDDVRVAHELAEGLAVPLLVLHVVSTALGTGSQIETLVTTGSPADEIGVIAAEHHVGLIVMGLVGTSGALGTRPGTVAYRVLCLATAPVLALPSGPDTSI
jgi:nucleotide-binding universal stress UspA family protein